MSRIIFSFILLCSLGMMAAGCGQPAPQSQGSQEAAKPLPAVDPLQKPEIPAEAKNIPLPQGY